MPVITDLLSVLFSHQPFLHSPSSPFIPSNFVFPGMEVLLVLLCYVTSASALERVPLIFPPITMEFFPLPMITHFQSFLTNENFF